MRLLVSESAESEKPRTALAVFRLLENWSSLERIARIDKEDASPEGSSLGLFNLRPELMIFCDSNIAC